jgi:Amino acid permease
MLVPSNDPDLLRATGTAAQSPFVIAMTRAGINVLPSILNAGIFTSAFSAGNSFLFCSSRILYGLALRGQAPRFLTWCTKGGLPLFAVIASVSRRHFSGGRWLLSAESESPCITRVHEYIRWRCYGVQLVRELVDRRRILLMGSHQFDVYLFP